MTELDTPTAIADLRRIAAWLAEQTDNDEAQGAASDLQAAADWFDSLELSDSVDTELRLRTSLELGTDRDETAVVIAGVVSTIAERGGYTEEVLTRWVAGLGEERFFALLGSDTARDYFARLQDDPQGGYVLLGEGGDVLYAREIGPAVDRVEDAWLADGGGDTYAGTLVATVRV